MSTYTFADAERWARQYRERIVLDLHTAMDSTSRQMQQDARTDHLFHNRTGKLHKSIRSEVKYIENESITLLFQIVPDAVLANGFNWGWGQNDGTLSRYRQGRISPPATPKNRKKKGIRHDDFMGRAWYRHYTKLKNRIETIFQRLI